MREDGMKRPAKSCELPVVFRSLDVEGKTQPLPAVICPNRRDLMTVGNCGECEGFRRIEFTADSQPVLRCAPEVIARDERSGPRRVQEAVRVPAICAAIGTPVAAVLPYLDESHRHEVIVVLDRGAHPLGLVPVEALRSLVANSGPLDTRLGACITMQGVRVTPNATLREAARLMDAAGCEQLVVTMSNGTFLGLVSRADLSDS
jgi:CBS-domain-containing membrane protein